MAGRWERTEAALEELGHLLGNMEPLIRGQPLTGQPLTGQPLRGQPLTGQPLTGQPLTGQPQDQVRILLNSLDQEAFEAGVARGIEMIKEGTDAK